MNKSNNRNRMNAKAIYDNAVEIKRYIDKTFSTSTSLNKLQKEHLSEQFSEFATKNPGIFGDIISKKLNWEKFKQLAEMAHSLHLQMNTTADPKEVRNVRF